MDLRQASASQPTVAGVQLIIAEMCGADEGCREVAAAALDHTLERIVVIDGDGVIVLANAAWQAAANGSDHAALLGSGVNYLDVCERCDAAVVAAGVRAVLDGVRPRFEFDYPCHSPTEDAWFALEVTPLGGSAGAVLTHRNITARVRADRIRTVGRGLDEATMLATSPSGVPGLAQRVADAQSSGSSLAVFLITLSDLVEIESQHGRRARDELVVHAVARVLRLTRADDVLIRPSTNQLMLFAGLANPQAAEFLCARIGEVLDGTYLVGASSMCSHVVVEVAVSDQFSTVDSLLHVLSGDPGPMTDDAPISTRGEIPPDGAPPTGQVDSFAPLVVYSLPDGSLQSANRAASTLFGLAKVEPGRLHARDVSDPVDLRRTETALRALSSGVTDSYRAHRTLLSGAAPLAVLTSARRLLIASGALAAVMTVPVDTDDVPANGADDPFAAALVAGTIDGRGAVSSLSVAASPMEAELIGVLDVSLRHAGHPADAHIVDAMLDTLGRTGSAAGEVRLPHSELGWVPCQFQLFAMQRPLGESTPGSPVVQRHPLAFVLSASIGTRPMMEKIARLERHIRRIGSEVHAADVALTTSDRPDRSVNSLLDSLDLTVRQREIVERLLRGQRVATIGAALYISQSTVRNHLARVYRLVGVHSQEALVEALRAA